MKYLKTEAKSATRTTILKAITIGFLGLVVLALVSTVIVSIPAGHRGVLLTFGKPTTLLGEGLNFKLSFLQSVQVLTVRTLKYETNASAASKDLQDVYATVALNYHLIPDETMTLYTNIGTNEMIEQTVIQPTVQESVKASTAQYNAEELITERPRVKEIIETSLKDRLTNKGIVVETISITDFQFSDEFAQAIEQKQVAQQNALKAERDLVRIRIEAEQIKAQAEGQANATLTKAMAEATAITLQGQALKENQNVVALRSIEKWNGVMPLVIGGGDMPFILDITNLNKTN